jgi:hypothetical protein
MGMRRRTVAGLDAQEHLDRGSSRESDDEFGIQIADLADCRQR